MAYEAPKVRKFTQLAVWMPDEQELQVIAQMINSIRPYLSTVAPKYKAFSWKEHTREEWSSFKKFDAEVRKKLRKLVEPFESKVGQLRQSVLENIGVGFLLDNFSPSNLLRDDFFIQEIWEGRGVGKILDHEVWQGFREDAVGIDKYFADLKAEAQTEPVHLGKWIYKGWVYHTTGDATAEQFKLLIMEDFDKERVRWERLRQKHVGAGKASIERPRIPEIVRVEVWRRDSGRCVKCGSRERLEYDHIVPLSKGGSNTARNVELLCENCNRAKGANLT